MNVDSESYIILKEETSRLKIIGQSKRKVQNGRITFEGLIFINEPGEHAAILVESDSIKLPLDQTWI